MTRIFFTALFLELACFIQSFSQVSLEQRVADLSQQIATEMTENQKTKIAVVEFSDLQGNVTDFGRFLAEELLTRLYQTKKFKVVERQLLNKVIAEQKLNASDLIDPTSAKQLGKLLGVDAIASGTITDLSQSLRVNARLMSTETGEIFAVASTEIFKDESVMKLMSSESKENPLSTKITAPNTEKTSLKNRNYVFQNDFIRVTINSLRKINQKTIAAIVVYECLDEKPFDIALAAPENTQMYLLDENGERWDYDTDAVGLNRWVKLMPKTKTTTKIIFKAKGDTDGKVFTMVSIFSDGFTGKVGKIIINDILLSQ